MHVLHQFFGMLRTQQFTAWADTVVHLRLLQSYLTSPIRHRCPVVNKERFKMLTTKPT